MQHAPPGGVDESALSTRVELSLSCRGLLDKDFFSKSDPFVVIYEADAGGRWREVLRTETVKNCLDPDFATHVTMAYKFERVQRLRFDVFDRDSAAQELSKHDFLGRLDTTLSKIMGSRGAVLVAPLEDMGGSGKSRGRIIVRGEEVASNKDSATLEFSASGLDRKDWFGLGRSDPFFVISRCREEGGWVKVHESEPVMKNLNPKWNAFDITVQKLCNGDLDRPIKVAVFDWNASGTHVLIGEVQTSVRALESGKSFTLKHPETAKKKGARYKGSGTLTVNRATIVKGYSFLDYIRGGCQLSLMVAIDFTASNGAPSTTSSLHYMPAHARMDGSVRDINQFNEYQRAILSIGQILEDYDSDRLIPVYGFGGAVNGQVQHAFPLTFDPSNPSVEGVEGVLAAYENAFQFVSLSGPTLFQHILTLAARSAEHCTQQKQEYTVMLILTDGVINDMDASIAEIVNASSLPLSIIIVGVGAADFSLMEELDADDAALVSRGRKAERDIVQFVPFRKFHNQGYQALAAETLAEVPEQLVSYMRSRQIRPQPPTLASQRLLAVEASQRRINGGGDAGYEAGQAPTGSGAGSAPVASVAGLPTSKQSVPMAVAVPEGGAHAAPPSAPPAPYHEL